MKFNISNSNGHTLYYRWFTFNDYTIKSSNVVSTNNTCVAFSSKTTTKEYPFNINRPRAGMIRVYASLADCNGDTKAKYARPSSKSNNRSVLKEIVVKYRPNNVTTNSSGFTIINKYNRSNLSKTIGSQTKGQCFMYALKYGAYILGKSSYTSNSTSVSTYSAVSHNATTLSEIYSAIVNNVNNGKPVVIHVWNNSSDTHYVTVVGYKRDSNGKVDSLDDIWVVDPYSNSGYGKKGTNVLWDGKALGRSTVKGINSTRRYITW